MRGGRGGERREATHGTARAGAARDAVRCRQGGGRSGDGGWQPRERWVERDGRGTASRRGRDAQGQGNTRGGAGRAGVDTEGDAALARGVGGWGAGKTGAGRSRCERRVCAGGEVGWRGGRDQMPPEGRRGRQVAP